MHLRNVELFCEIAHKRSFSKAADAQSVSQSSASQAVNYLEKRLGTQLIDRSVRPLGLTPAGKIFFDGCRKLLDGFRLIEDRVRRMTDAVAGRVRVAAIYSVGLLQMDTYVRRFQELYPDAELQVAYLHPDEVYNRVLNDEADLGLVSFPKDGGDVGCIPWQEQPFVLVVPPNHRLAGRRNIPVQELRGEDFVAFTPELRIRRKIDRWLKEVNVSVNPVHAFDNIENIKRAVEIGSGIALLPEPTVQREVEIEALRALKLTNVEWTRPLGVIHRRNKSLTTVADKFVELLHDSPTTFSRNGQTSDSLPAADSNGDKKSKRPSASPRKRKRKRTAAH